eukprot:TRINITY_DN3237_c0_g2_i2.p2 TRINITY_DN3237_c0_g2~~TRINITY_DN3237_c0_g2_i2.p2  ORF type:complete len:256 (+),score=28.66 TRINITY_DN3237_c0_g2_i2:106-873(+)
MLQQHQKLCKTIGDQNSNLDFLDNDNDYEISPPVFFPVTIDAVLQLIQFCTSCYQQKDCFEIRKEEFCSALQNLLGKGDNDMINEMWVWLARNSGTRSTTDEQGVSYKGKIEDIHPLVRFIQRFLGNSSQDYGRAKRRLSDTTSAKNLKLGQEPAQKLTLLDLFESYFVGQEGDKIGKEKFSKFKKFSYEVFQELKTWQDFSEENLLDAFSKLLCVKKVEKKQCTYACQKLDLDLDSYFICDEKNNEMKNDLGFC